MKTAFTLLLCCVPLAVFASMLGTKWRFALAFYVLVYLPLSWQGQFLTVNGGGMDWQDYWFG